MDGDTSLMGEATETCICKLTVRVMEALNSPGRVCTSEAVSLNAFRA